MHGGVVGILILPLPPFCNHSPLTSDCRGGFAIPVRTVPVETPFALDRLSLFTSERYPGIPAAPFQRQVQLTLGTQLEMRHVEVKAELRPRQCHTALSVLQLLQGIR